MPRFFYYFAAMRYPSATYALLILFCAVPIDVSAQGLDALLSPSDYYVRFQEMRDRNAVLDSIHAQFESWSAAIPNSLSPYYWMATVYLERGERNDSARAVIQRGFQIALHNPDGVRKDYPSIDNYIPHLYYMLAKIARNEGDDAAALGFIKAGDAFNDDGHSALALMIEAAIWKSYNRNDLAERAYLQGFLTGYSVAGDSLRVMFVQENGSEEGYSLYLNLLAEDMLEKAPPLRGEDLLGQQLDLEQYRGKVVVVTFWFIGCPGCLIEEPALARLTDAVDTSEVALISIARDPAVKVSKHLRGAYIKGHGQDFYHRHIADAADLITAFEVTSFPTHIVVDREGRITARRTGGSRQTDRIL
ncbi:MAG: hypothetical protein CL946_12220, partial [Ectothiorhodospiraceae bacterium]|nr:hypothetical protein [Ectothiorhodospiraceae bacterium]